MLKSARAGHSAPAISGPDFFYGDGWGVGNRPDYIVYETMAPVICFRFEHGTSTQSKGVAEGVMRWRDKSWQAALSERLGIPKTLYWASDFSLGWFKEVPRQGSPARSVWKMRIPYPWEVSALRYGKHRLPCKVSRKDMKHLFLLWAEYLGCPMWKAVCDGKESRYELADCLDHERARSAFVAFQTKLGAPREFLKEQFSFLWGLNFNFIPMDDRSADCDADRTLLMQAGCSDEIRLRQLARMPAMVAHVEANPSVFAHLIAESGLKPAENTKVPITSVCVAHYVTPVKDACTRWARSRISEMAGVVTRLRNMGITDEEKALAFLKGNGGIKGVYNNFHEDGTRKVKEERVGNDLTRAADLLQELVALIGKDPSIPDTLGFSLVIHEEEEDFIPG
jgi:hypothetical protein